MRRLMLNVLILSAAATAAFAEPRPAREPQAVSAERFAKPAAQVGYTPHAYSEDARRIADCLATYPSYDHRTDRVEVRPGVTQRCPF